MRCVALPNWEGPSPCVTVSYACVCVAPAWLTASSRQATITQGSHRFQGDREQGMKKQCQLIFYRDTAYQGVGSSYA